MDLSVSSDTNIWFDFYSISRIELPFRLSFRYLIYKEALRKEIVSPPHLLSVLIDSGLTGVELTSEEFFYAESLSGKYVKLSGYDRTALAIAKKRDIPLLTGDLSLRKAAVKEGVQVFGTIWLIDSLYESGKIDAKEYIYCLESLRKNPDRRLPSYELDKRIAEASPKSC